MMKGKLFAFFTAVMLTLALAGCTTTAPGTTTSPTTTVKVTTTVVPTTTTSPTATIKLSPSPTK